MLQRKQSPVLLYGEFRIEGMSVCSEPLADALKEMVMLLEWWSGTDCTLYTDPESYHKYGKENAIVILNHNFEIDFLCGWNFCERFGVLGSAKVLAKKELSYVPVIGWMWYFLEIVFCKRKWEEDRKTVMQGLFNLRDYPENFWFLIHCEGTRFTEQKHQISMQVAEAKGLPKLKYHLLPRTKGFAVTVQCLRNVVSAVYDSTLNFRNNENPTLLGVLSGKKYHADLYVRRIPLEEIPEDEQECSNWLHKLYQEKDAIQEEYYRTGVYPETPIVPPRRPWTLLNWLFWALLLLYPLFKLLINMVSSGSSLTLASFAFVFIVDKLPDAKPPLTIIADRRFTAFYQSRDFRTWRIISFHCNGFSFCWCPMDDWGDRNQQGLYLWQQRQQAETQVIAPETASIQREQMQLLKTLKCISWSFK
uniref:1-acyl-sn-glycerol-3-phosphate acyltransferase delta n=1 Tax=Crocodylus porosus TaxID=8502 RepID=A0A7M4FI15_CROPO